MKRIIALAALCLFTASGSAQAPASAPITPLMYVVRDADSTLYLFGTIHVRRPGAPWGGAAAEVALAQADEVWTEIDMGAPLDPEATERLLALARMPDGGRFSDLLTPQQNAAVERALIAANMPLASYAPMQPWYVAIMLSYVPIMQAGYEARAGADSQISEISTRAGVRRRFFETAEQQLRFFAGLSQEAQIEMLVDAVEHLGPDAAAENAALERLWERGDARALERVVITELRRDYPELYQAIFVRRNRAWTQTLESELEGAGVDFVAVGAGHLLGRDGLVRLLRQQGYRVEQLSPAR